MGLQTLYINERGRSVMHETGFSWLGLIAPPIWALRRRLPRTALVLAIASLGVDALGGWWVTYWLLVKVFAFAVFGARVHRALLERLGYRAIAQELRPAPMVKATP